MGRRPGPHPGDDRARPQRRPREQDLLRHGAPPRGDPARRALVPRRRPPAVHQRPQARPHLQVHPPRHERAARAARHQLHGAARRGERRPQGLPPWSLNKTLSTTRRTVYDWLPIHALTTRQVFNRIREAGQEPFRAYATGNRRLSCVFCILGCAGDLANGRRERPELFQRYLQLERETGWTMFPGQSLAQRAAEGDARRRQTTDDTP